MMKWLILVLSLSLLLCSMIITGCSSDDNNDMQPQGTAIKKKEKASTPTEKASPGETESEDQATSGYLPWEDIPIYSGAELEMTEDCPPQWQKCKKCERRVYTTGAAPADVCSFYKDEMPAKNWDKIVYQFYPEGACTGTWMADMGNSSGPRVIMGIGQRSSSDDSTTIGITMGSGCP